MSGLTKDSRNLKQGAVILLLSSVIVKLIGALFKIPLASDFCLGDLGFGYFSSAYDVFMPVYFAAISGFPVAISRMVSDFASRNYQREAEKTLAVAKRVILIFSAFCFVLFVICVFPFVNFTDKTGKSIYSFLAVAPSIIFCLWVSCYRGYFEGLGNMMPAAVSGIIEALGKLVLGLGFAVGVIKLGGDPAIAAAAAMIGISIGSLASALYLKIIYKLNNGIGNYDASSNYFDADGRSIAKKLIIISLPIVFASLSSSIVALVDGLTVRYQLSKLISENTDALNGVFSALLSEYENSVGESLSHEALPTFLYGIRGKAYTLFNLIPTLTISVGVGLIPAVTENFAKKDVSALKDNIGAVLKISALICFPASAGFMVFGERIMSLLYGAGASSQLGGRMLVIYGIAVIFAGFSFPLAGVLQAIGNQNRVFVNVICGILIKTVLNLVLCSRESINILGAAYSTLACFGVICLLHIATLLLKTGRFLNIANNILKPAVSAVICVALAYLVGLSGDSVFVTVVVIAVAAVTYFVFLVLFNTFDESDISALPAGKKLVKICKKLKIVK